MAVRRERGGVRHVLFASGEWRRRLFLPRRDGRNAWATLLAVVGDGAVGLLAVLSARQKGAGPLIAMSRHPTRQTLAREYGATDIVAEGGEAGVARIKELTHGICADAVLECVGTKDSMDQAIRSTRPGGSVGFVGVPHGVELDLHGLFFSHVRLHGGPAPVRQYLPELIELVLSQQHR